MKRLLYTFLFLLLLSNLAIAQSRRQPNERIHAAKMAYINERMKLTPSQYNVFLPVYNEYETELRGIRQSFFKKYHADPASCSRETAMQYIDDDLDYQQQVLELKRRYKDHFLQVLSPEQLVTLHKAEREFKQMLMEHLPPPSRHGMR